MLLSFSKKTWYYLIFSALLLRFYSLAANQLKTVQEESFKICLKEKKKKYLTIIIIIIIAASYQSMEIYEILEVYTKDCNWPYFYSKISVFLTKDKKTDSDKLKFW